MILQEYAPSRNLYDAEGRPHIGCIRHIAHLFSTGNALGFMHLPSYWRVAPEPISETPRKRSFTANISSGARPLPLDESEVSTVRRAAEKIGLALAQMLRRGQLSNMGPTGHVTSRGAVCWCGKENPLPSLPLAVDKICSPSISNDTPAIEGALSGNGQ